MTIAGAAEKIAGKFFDKGGTVFNVNHPDFGAKGDGTTDDSTAVNAAITAALAAGADLSFAPGTYKFSSQVTCSVPLDRRMNIYAHGAVVITTGAISGLAITGRGQGGGVSVHGLVVNHRGNANADYAFDIYSATGVRLIDCGVEAHGVKAGYAGVILRNGTPSDDNTGSFWNEIHGFRIGKRNGADTGDIPIGILMHGQANATKIYGGNIGGTVTTGILIEPESGQTSLSNGVLIDGVSLEGGTDAIKVLENNTAPIGGLRIINCRVESFTTFFNISGASSTKTGSPTWLAGNYITPGSVTNYILNTNSQYVNTMDFSVTPALNVKPYLRGAGGLTVAPTVSTEHSFKAVPSANGVGYKLEDQSGVDLGSWVQRQFGGASFKGGTNGTFMSLIQGISAGATEAKNLRGSKTFVASTTATVTFATAEPDANYFVVVGCDSNVTIWVTSRGTGGFTLNASASTSATVWWVIVR